ncbi:MULTISPECIES: penicillin-binding protein activator [Halocynthiibacter]|uniref:Penicillin-binding protein activator n=1 Tax=Halocynthiibacter halioticoli TaxID=2986804 RepID=A0AAE3LSL7_9RHOB|nr:MULTISPECIES: penicillin-binding protein activator [Halocynthiibacter]MCV6823631.1 penicillin-binding protein activator [Halocynthiibacter halioticoli]MCW4056632.1 penicillin-binding protein activator [Halocynthiibacter sp. SDUM655004]
MLRILRNARFGLQFLLLGIAAIFLAACQPGGTGGGPSINTQKAVPVALLVPGNSASSGDNLIAAALENSARLAIADLQGVEIDLRVYNTSGRADVAATVAKEAVSDGAKIILGPLYAESANAVGVAISNKNVNILAFSNKPDIAGGNVFVLGNTFQNTADRIVSYAARQGISSAMVISGSGNLSEDAGRDALVTAANNSGVTVAALGTFEMSQQGVINAIPDLAASAKSSGAQALLFASGTEGALPLLTQLLPENGIDPTATQFIGLTRWDIPASTLALPGVQSGWFALPDPGLAAQFASRYENAYGQPPHPIAGLSYDGIAAIGALVRAGKSDALTQSALTQPSGFVGVNGVFRLLPDGTNQRGLAIGQIQDNQVNIIDPAPRSFSGTGF